MEERRNKRKKIRQRLAWLLLMGIVCCGVSGGLLLLPAGKQYAEASGIRRVGNFSETDLQTETETKSEPETLTESEALAESECAAESGCAAESECAAETDIGTESDRMMEFELDPCAIIRGVHYELTGDPGAWYQDPNGLLWVRSGTSLYANPKTGSGYDMGASEENVQSDGIFSFRLRTADGTGAVAEESAAASVDYCVDGEAPSARFQISGACREGIFYNSEVCTVTITVEPDGESGLKDAFYKIASCDLYGRVEEGTEASAWTECASASEVQISEEGLCRVYVKTEDMVGNTTFSRSDIICIDSTGPEIVISGVENESANAGTVILHITCTDAYYQMGSMQVQISGAGQGNVPSIKQSGGDSGGEWAEYYDFPMLQSYDDVYDVTVTALDQAGNTAEKTIRFSVNRFGPVYDLSADTKALLEQYDLTEAPEMVFYETNMDYSGESCIYCRCDGVLSELVRGRDYFVTKEGTETSWKRYRYEIPAAYFSQEGVYELLLVPGAARENSDAEDSRQKRVTFQLK